MPAPHLLPTAALLLTLTSAAPPPNFVFLLSESLDGRLLRESSPAKIPHIRALLASGSVRFDAAYSNNPVCAPSRASLWSGRAPHKIPHMHNGFPVAGAWNNYEGLPTDYAQRMDQLLSAAGYAVSLKGKEDWTVGSHTESCRLASFTFNVPWPYNTSRPSWGWNEEDATCNSPGPVAPGGSAGSNGSSYAGDWGVMTDTAAFAAAAAQPFFAFAGTSILHPPYQTTRYWFDVAAPTPNPVWQRLQDKHPCAFQSSMKRGCAPAPDAPGAAAFYDPARITRVRRVYLAELEEFDAMVGEVVASLKAAGRLENTWIVLAADHGACRCFFDHPRAIYLPQPSCAHTHVFFLLLQATCRWSSKCFIKWCPMTPLPASLSFSQTRASAKAALLRNPHSCLTFSPLFSPQRGCRYPPGRMAMTSHRF